MGPRFLFSGGLWVLWGKKPGDDRDGLRRSSTRSSFSMRSARALRVTSKGSKPRSSSCCCLDEPKPNAACQSVDDDTGMVSVDTGDGL